MSIPKWARIVVVYAYPLVIRGDTVKHALTSTSPPPQWHPLYTLEPSSTTPLKPLGGLQEGFPTSLCISDVGLHGSCWWATPQPGDLSLQVVNTRTLYTGTAQRRRAEFNAWHYGNCSDLPCNAHGKGVVQSGNQVPILHRETRRPHSSRAEAQPWISYGHAYPSGKTWAILRAVLRGIHCSQEYIKHRKQTSVRGCTNPTTSHIGFND